MDEKLIDAKALQSVLKTVGIRPEEGDQCMAWTSPKFDEPLSNRDRVLAELTQEEQGFLRCMGYASEEKVVDILRLRALYEIFWGIVRKQHNLPPSDLTIREGKYVVGT